MRGALHAPERKRRRAQAEFIPPSICDRPGAPTGHMARWELRYEHLLKLIELYKQDTEKRFVKLQKAGYAMRALPFLCEKRSIRRSESKGARRRNSLPPEDVESKKEPHGIVDSVGLARLRGFEPPAYRLGVKSTHFFESSKLSVVHIFRVIWTFLRVVVHLKPFFPSNIV